MTVFRILPHSTSYLARLVRRVRMLCISLCLSVGFANFAHALSAEQVQALAIGDGDARVAAIQKLLTANDLATDPTALPFLQALLDDAVKVAGKTVLVVTANEVRDAATGASVALPDNAEDVVNNNRMRGELEAAIAALRLFAPELAVRQAATKALAENLDTERLPLIQKAAQQETHPALKTKLLQLQARLQLQLGTDQEKLAALQILSESSDPAIRTLLLERLAKQGETFVEPELAIRSQMQIALKKVEGRLAWGERVGLLFAGVSLGSILLLAALGLAITYGLMGVINMAHGELMMIGAYATYLVQNLFQQYLPNYFQFYLLAALPVAFLTAAIVGMILERLVLRFLYGRPLETLLATWGISLFLIQIMRTLFGAQNVQVENPAWMSGGFEILTGIILPWNRIVIVVFAFAILLGMSLLLARTRLGLFVRAVTQNRSMAACMGVHTGQIDMLAFALGAGIAGLAGCALSQIGNVGPDLGQSYIVDSFMVVVLGGVGQLAGTVYAGLGLGIMNKLLENWTGAVLAKITVLVIIIIFIQRRPQGLFALKGRSVE